MVDLYRIWSDNSTSFIGRLDIVSAKQYAKLMGGSFKIVPVKEKKAA